MCGLVILVTTAFSAPQKLTVDEAVAIAQEHNRLIRISELEVAKSASAVSSAKTHLYPVVSLSADSGQLLTSTSFRIPAGSLGVVPGLGAFPQRDANIKSGTDWTTFGVLTVAQPISQIPSIRLNIRLAEEQKQLNGEQLRQRHQELADEVRAACYQYVQATAGVKAAQAAVELGNEAVRVADQAVSKGAELDQVSLQAKSKRTAAVEQVIELTDAAEVARMHVNLLLGRDLSTSFEMDAPSPTAMPLPPSNGACLAATQSRPEVLEAKRKVTMAGLAVQIRRREDDPDLSLILTAARPVGVDFLPDSILMLGFRVSWTPVDWGRRNSDLTAKKTEVEQAKWAVLEAQQQVALDAELKYRAVLRQRAAVATAEAEFIAAQEKARVTHERDQAGSATPKDVLEANYLLAAAEAKRTSAYCELATAQSALQRAMGND